MIPDRDQYVHFTIKLLKGSPALQALRQDALTYHMIDHPDKLIALRLTEYYELIARGTVRPGPSVQTTPASSLPANGNGTAPAPRQPESTTPRELAPVNDVVVGSSLTLAEQKAEEAADYWAPL